VKNAFANCLVQLSVGILKSSFSGLLVTACVCLTHSPYSRLQFGADSLVTRLCLAVSLNPLDLGLDICHFLLSYEDFGDTPKQAKTLAGGANSGNHLRELSNPQSPEVACPHPLNS
jgi:hypothetical protein